MCDIIIGCSLKDCIKELPQFRRSIENLIQNCEKSIELFVYENNSEDGTKEFLSSWQRDSHFVHIKCETLMEIDLASIARDFKNNRCQNELLSQARNKLLDFIESSKSYSSSQYILMLNINDGNILPIEQLAVTLENPPIDFDALIAYGYDAEGRVADIVSYRTFEFPFGPEVIGQEYFEPAYKKTIASTFEKNMNLIPLVSCNGGIFIFKKEAIFKRRYSCLPTAFLHTYYKKRCDEIINPCQYTFNNSAIGMYYFDDSVFYFNTHDCNYPIVSMHCNMLVEMRLSGYDKIFMYTKLRWPM